MVFNDVIEKIGMTIDAAGVVLIVTGAAIAFVVTAVRRSRRGSDVYRRFRQQLGQAILLGLEDRRVGAAALGIVGTCADERGEVAASLPPGARRGASSQCVCHEDPGGRRLHRTLWPPRAPSRDVEAAVARTRLDLPHELSPQAVEPTARLQTSIEVTGESTLATTRRLAASTDGEVGALNFASAHRPGGGFLSGASAQELPQLALAPPRSQYPMEFLGGPMNPASMASLMG